MAGSNDHDHILVIYEDATELVKFAVPFIRDGLAHGERVAYVSEDLALSDVIGALDATGVDVRGEIDRGALMLLTAKEFYEPLDASKIVGLIGRTAKEARSRRFTGTRLAGEVAGALKLGFEEDALVEYEALLDASVSGFGPVTIACLYQRTKFQPLTLQRLIQNHSAAVASDHVHVSLSALFQDLARPDVERLLQSANERRIPKGGYFFLQGDPSEELYVLTNGKVKFTRTDPAGQTVMLGIVTPPNSFGEGVAIAGQSRLGSAQALEDSRALAWDVATILELMTRHPTISLNTIRLIVDRFMDQLDRVQDLTSAGVERRLARSLLRLAGSIGRRTADGVVLELQLSGRDLADFASTTPYTVSRILADWRRLGVLDAQRERILIVDQRRFASIAGATS